LKHRVADWQTPTWLAGKYKDSSEMGIGACHRLRTAAGGVWMVGASRCSPGPNLYRLEGAIRVDEYNAADYPMVSCATDVAESAARNLLFVSCTGDLHEARMDGTRLVLERTVPTLSDEGGQKASSDELIATAGREVFIGFTTPDNRPGRVRIARVEKDRTVEIGRFSGAALASLGVSPRSVVAVLRKADGAFESVALPRNPGS
jgi:hypothetical protein